MASMSSAARVSEQGEIDLLELAQVLWRKIWFILIGFIAGAAVAFSVTSFLITPQYKAESIIYIFSKTTSITSLADLQIGSQLTGDFTVIATTREVVESVIDELRLDTSYEALVNRITVSNPSSSRLLKISIKDTDPSRAALICNTLSDKLRDQIADIMNTDRPSVVQRAVVPKHQDSPNVVQKTEIGALLGALLVAAVIVVRHLLDDTIKNPDDVKKYLGVDVLAVFPYIRGLDNKKSGQDRASSPSYGKQEERSEEVSPLRHKKSSRKEETAKEPVRYGASARAQKLEEREEAVKKAVRELEEEVVRDTRRHVDNGE